eukprot:840924-Rhodomonas_salina.1
MTSNATTREREREKGRERAKKATTRASERARERGREREGTRMAWKAAPDGGSLAGPSSSRIEAPSENMSALHKSASSSPSRTSRLT